MFHRFWCKTVSKLRCVQETVSHILFHAICMPSKLHFGHLSCTDLRHMSQRTTKPTIRLVRPAKIQISLLIRAVWSESSLIACVVYSLRAIWRGINEKPCHTEWMYRLIWVCAGHTGLIVGFCVRWLICKWPWSVLSMDVNHWFSKT